MKLAIGLRRAGIAAVLATATACATMRPRTESIESQWVNEAIVAAGGESALRRAGVLHWTGEATVHAGDQRLELGVDTTVAPFASARSSTWLKDRGLPSQRELTIDGDQGWMQRNGRREPMPASMLAHERAQYAVYGLMRLVSLRDPGVRLQRRANAGALRVLHVEHPLAPPADMHFDSRGRLRGLDDQVPDAQSGSAVHQHFEFEGELVADGVHWPRVLRISQDGAPYFELRFTTLAVSPH